MLFGDIDWNRVLMQGLIGGAIGGAIGLVIFIVKKMSGGKGPDDERDRNER